MLELELKLAVEGSFAPTLQPGRAGVAGIEELAPLDLRATYYDTPDLRLARHGITLRHRTGEGDRPGWTLKLPNGRDNGVGREELHFDGAARSVPGEAIDLITAFVRSATIAPVARLRTRRRRWSLRGREGEELAELVDDRVSVLQRGRVVERFREIEPLHQMRVGTRRLRSDLRTFRPLLDREWADGLREELRWLGGVLGEVRDLDVMLERLHEGAGELEGDLRALFESLERDREKARETLLGALRSARYVDLLERLVEASRSPILLPAAEEPCAKALPPLVARSWRKLASAGRALGPESPDEEFHRVRVLAKRARYGAEAIAPAIGRKRGAEAKKFARRAARLQDLLGELQDSVVA